MPLYLTMSCMSGYCSLSACLALLTLYLRGGSLSACLALTISLQLPGVDNEEEERLHFERLEVRSEPSSPEHMLMAVLPAEQQSPLSHHPPNPAASSSSHTLSPGPLPLWCCATTH